MTQTSVFITGGAGYIGTSLIPLLLEEGYKVTVYDSLLYGNGDVLIPFIANPNFKFIYGDIRDKKKLEKAIKDHNVVVHLAALVGYPYCKKAGDAESWSVNVEGTSTLIECLSPDQYLVYSSTGSNYGIIDGVCTEESPLEPLTIYGKTKTAAERLVMARDNSTAFRYATAFGVSSKLRLDLLINDLVYRCMTDGYVVIYESHFMRTFIHVRDMGASILYAIQHRDSMKDHTFNVGSNDMNFSKKQICELIKEYVPTAYINYADIGEDADKRNYVVSYEKINKAGFYTSIGIRQGIEELVKTVPVVRINSLYHGVFNNVNF